jgi:methylthioribose-1-phosphate isomerase
MMLKFKSLSIQYDGETLCLIDQTLLPDHEEWVEIQSLQQMHDFIFNLKVRGAPLIGVSAGLYLGLISSSVQNKEDFFKACYHFKTVSANSRKFNVCY